MIPAPVATRPQALEYLDSRINYERRPARNKSRSFKLQRMRRLLDLLGNPQERIPAVHLAGTKGKGSTAVMTAGMLSTAGYKTALFTSPHVSAFEERMQVDGGQPSESELIELVNAVAGPAEMLERSSADMRPTYFEIATAMAWLYFVRAEADVAVLEVGLGGRLDATNLCRPEVTAITNISYDHTAVLGRKLGQIAREKAGIVKPGVPVLSGVEGRSPRHEVEAACREKGAPLYELGREVTFRRHGETRLSREAGFLAEKTQRVDVQTPWRCWPAIAVPLAGRHQAANAALAMGIIDLLDRQGRPVAAEAARRGMAGVRWPVRIEVVGRAPTVVIDAAHNRASADALAATLQVDFPAHRRILIFAATKDKDVAGMLRRLAGQFDEIILTQYRSNPRGVPVDELHGVFRRVTDSWQAAARVRIAAEPHAAWRTAAELASPADLICITGSFFIAAEMRDFVLAEHPGRGFGRCGPRLSTAGC